MRTGPISLSDGRGHVRSSVSRFENTRSSAFGRPGDEERARDSRLRAASAPRKSGAYPSLPPTRLARRGPCRRPVIAGQRLSRRPEPLGCAPGDAERGHPLPNSLVREVRGKTDGFDRTHCLFTKCSQKTPWNAANVTIRLAASCVAVHRSEAKKMKRIEAIRRDRTAQRKMVLDRALER